MSTQLPPASDNAPTIPPSPAPAPTAKRSSRSFLLRVLGSVILLAGIGWAAWYFFDGRWYAGTDDAYINGNVVQITPQIAGTVVSIGADDGDLVHAGAVLVQLDPNDAKVAYEQAVANLARFQSAGGVRSLGFLPLYRSARAADEEIGPTV